MIEVSILTPTYERTPFIPHLMKMIRTQTADLHTIEWIVVDDSAVSSHKLFDTCELQSVLHSITYLHLPQKRSIGCKRNITKHLAQGKYIIHMDDDDYYAPNYISTVLTMFHSPTSPPIIGATIVYLMYQNSFYLYRIGPVSTRHTCGGAMSYTKEYAQEHQFKNDAKKAEESAFVDKNEVMQINNIYNINMIFVHNKNTVNKQNIRRHKTNMRWIDIIQHSSVLLFYLSLHADTLPFAEEFRTLQLSPSSRTTYGTTFLFLTLLQSVQNIAQTLMLCLPNTIQPSRVCT